MLARAFTLFGCFIAATGLIGRAAHSEPPPSRMPFALLPMRLGEWRGVQEPPLDEKTRAVLGVDDYLSRVYFRSPRSGVGLYLGFYRSQRQGETIHSPLNCLPGSGWEPLSKTVVQISAASVSTGTEAPIWVNRYVVQKGLDHDLVLYWYQSHGRVIASEYISKFYLISDAIRLNRTDGALVRVIAPFPSNVEDGEARAERDAVQFVKVLFPRLGDYLPR